MRLPNRAVCLPLLLLTATPLAMTTKASAAQPPAVQIAGDRQPAVVTNGSGEVNIVPNIAIINLGVETRDTDSSRATTANAAKMEQVLKVIRALGVEDKDVQTVNYSINDTTEGEAKNPKRFYVVNNTVRVAVRKIGDAGKILDAATQAGANSAGGIQFDADDETKDRAYDAALTKAVTAAARKAKTIVTASGTSIIQLIELTEAGMDVFPPRVLAMARFAEAKSPVSWGELTVRASVTARYSISPFKNQ